MTPNEIPALPLPAPHGHKTTDHKGCELELPNGAGGIPGAPPILLETPSPYYGFFKSDCILFLLAASKTLVSRPAQANPKVLPSDSRVTAKCREPPEAAPNRTEFQHEL